VIAHPYKQDQDRSPQEDRSVKTTLTNYRFFFFRGGWRETGSNTNRAFNNPRGSSPAAGRVPANMARAWAATLASTWRASSSSSQAGAPNAEACCAEAAEAL